MRCWFGTPANPPPPRTSGRGVEAMAPSYGLLDMTVYGWQETWEDSPAGWPQMWRINSEQLRTNGRPSAQWSRLESGRSDDREGYVRFTLARCWAQAEGPRELIGRRERW